MLPKMYIKSTLIRKQLTHRILTACLRVHISYRTHPRAQISLQRGESRESKRREHTDGQAGISSGVALHSSNKVSTVNCRAFLVFFSNWRKKKTSLLRKHHIEHCDAAKFTPLVVIKVDWITCILKIVEEEINTGFLLWQQTSRIT